MTKRFFRKFIFLMLLVVFSCLSFNQLSSIAAVTSNTHNTQVEQWKVYDNLGWSCFNNDDYPNAILNFKKAIIELDKMPITPETEGQKDFYKGFILNIENAMENGYLIDID